MRSSIISGTIVAAAALALMSAADAKPATKPAKGPLTLEDARACITGATAKDQIAACTKVIESGKVLKPYLADYYATRAAAYQADRQFQKALADLNTAL